MWWTNRYIFAIIAEMIGIVTGIKFFIVRQDRVVFYLKGKILYGLFYFEKNVSFN